MDSATIIYTIGFLMIFVGEMKSLKDDVPRNTISHRLWWFTGKGREITVWFFFSRIILFGFITWWLLHTAGVDV